MIVALISTYKIEKDQTQVIPQVIMLLIPYYVMIARELYFVLLDQLGEISD